MLAQFRFIFTAILITACFMAANSAFAQAVDTGFDPDADDAVRDILVLPSGDMLVAGDFSNIDGHPTNGIALLDHTGKAITSFTSGLTATKDVFAFSVDISGNIVVVGADTSNGFVRRLIGTTGALDTSFSAFGGITGASVKAVAIQADGNIVIGGNFTVADGVARNNIARLSGTDGDIQAFDPDANSQVYTIAIQPLDQKILIGGVFTVVGSVSHTRVARLETDGTLDTSFNPDADAVVNSIAIQLDGRILVGGQFTTLDGGTTTLTRLGRLELDGTTDTAFVPVLDLNVFAIEIQTDAKIVVGGSFTERVARFNINGSVDASFTLTHTANSTVLTVAERQDGGIIVGGVYSIFAPGTIIRQKIALLSANGGLDVGFNPGAGASSDVRTTAIQPDGKIIIGGNFITFNGAQARRITRLNADGSLDSTFTGTGANNSVYATVIQPDGKIIIGGDFSQYGSTQVDNIARLNADGSIDTTFNPTGSGANGTIWTIAIQPDGKIVIGGNLTSYNGTNRSRIARLNTDGSLDTTFNPGSGASSVVFSTAIQPDGKIIVGGAFTTFRNTGFNRIVRLNANGTLDGNFTPGTGASQNVYSTTVQPDGKIIIGGTFTQYDGTTSRRIGRLNADGTLDTTFVTGNGANNIVYSTAIQADGKVIIGGAFTTYDSTTRNRIARLNTDGSIDTTFSNGANGSINTTAIQSDGSIVIGGNLTAFSGTGVSYITRLTNTGVATQQLAYTGSAFTFTPGGTMPSPLRLEFETSTDGVTYTASGSATWNAGLWEQTGVGLPIGWTWLRAKAHIQGGSSFGHSGYELEFTRTIYIAPNAPPVVSVPAGSNWFDAGGGLFTLTLNPGDSINDALSVTDPTPDDMAVTITAPATSLTTLSAQPVTNATFMAGPLTLLWTGTADAGNVPGDYQWVIDINDGTSSTTGIIARIIVTDVPPAHVIDAATGGDGSTGTPYTASFLEGDGTSVSVDLATITDANTGQTLSISGSPSQTSGPTTGNGFQWNLVSNTLIVSPASTLVLLDAGVQVFDVVVTDGGANNVTITVAITVSTVSGNITFTNTSPLAAGTVNTAYATVTLAATGGTPAYTFAVVNGTSLPAGLMLSTGGDITGTPTAAGTTSFDVRVTDSTNDSATMTFDITINAAGGGGGDGDDDEGGCAVSTTGANIWLAIIGLLGLVAVIRLRREVAE